MKQNCTKCRFSRMAGENMFCHREPPRAQIVGEKIHAPRPPTHPEGWCGEFKRAWPRLFRRDGQA